ncbi:tetratricopeptide repeat protein [Kordia zhangzhouensis]|uniref:tetratricopeptide repeat protein n=1 Tax=Kordia zhangzhouensis TaxID=1620405 RepID=UPI000629BE91|nr:tetratricopeptide repeat protein [Kordia zhangzhouensis]
MKKLFYVCAICFAFKVEAQISTLSVADSLYQMGNFSKAISLYQTLENSNNKNVNIAKAYKALGNLQKAIESYEKALVNDSLNSLVLYDYGKLLYSVGDLKKSLVIFEKLKSKDTTNPNFHYHLGIAKEGLLQEDYIHSYLEAFKLDNQHQKSIHKLIKYYLETKEIENASQIIKIGLQNNPNDAKIIGFNAQLYYLQKKYRKALVWFEKLITSRKATQYVYEKAAFSAYRVGRILKAISYYEEALKKDEGNYFYHSQLAKLYYQDGIHKKAEHHASQAIVAKMIDTSGDYYILGLVHFDRKEYKKAIKLFKMALEEDPMYEAAQFQLTLCADNYYSDLKEKLNMYERFIEKFPNGNEDMRKIINTRIRELKEEIHLKAE